MDMEKSVWFTETVNSYMLLLYFIDVLFGYPWKKTGISRYFIRNRQRTISFAVTIILKEYDDK